MYGISKQLNGLINQKLSKETFIVQPYIQSVTKSGQVFDFRFHVQKNGNGEWVITTIYPRIAPQWDQSSRILTMAVIQII